MCLILAAIFLGLAITAFGQGDIPMGLLHALITAAFLLLMIYNIKKTRDAHRKPKD